MRLDGLKQAAAAPSAAALETARYGFARAHPQRSARRVLFFTQGIALAASIAGFVWAARAAPALTFDALHIAALVVFTAAILVRLIAAASLAPFLSRLADQPNVPTYTILCPLYHEANAAPDLVEALTRLDYPTEALDIKLLVEGDDVDTIAAALAVSGAPHIEADLCSKHTFPSVGLAACEHYNCGVCRPRQHPNERQRKSNPKSSLRRFLAAHRKRPPPLGLL